MSHGGCLMVFTASKVSLNVGRLMFICAARDRSNCLNSGQLLSSALTGDWFSLSFFPPLLLSVMLYSWGKGHFPPNASHTAVNITERDNGGHLCENAAAVGLFNRSEDESTFWIQKFVRQVIVELSSCRIRAESDVTLGVCSSRGSGSVPPTLSGPTH